jgi:GTP pyrophosphokinase
VLRSSGEPAAAHAARVASIVRHEFGISACDVLVLALLHDVLEDSDVEIEDLERKFGRRWRRT